MITIEEALARVENEAKPLTSRELPLIECRGRALAEAILADADEPRFDKSLVDGYAVRAADLVDRSTLRVGETILAGQSPSRGLAAHEAAVIMTGAPLPPSADAVVMHEETDSGSPEVRFLKSGVAPGQNMLPRARVYRQGDRVLQPGMRLSPSSLGLLASVGRTHARVVPRPRLAIVSTGDELVEVGQSPGPGQIRNSNAVMLNAMAIEWAAVPTVLPIAPDEPAGLERILRQGLEHDILVISGGVSAGQRDLVPSALEKLGVRPIFHKVRLKPGKPIWFGVHPAGDGLPGTLVFGLPGNPVSSLVGFLLFVAPAIESLGGLGWKPSARTSAQLTTSFHHRGDRPTYHPASWIPGTESDVAASVRTLSWAGSADLLTIARADGFVAFPAGERTYLPGDMLPFLPHSRSLE